jgi:hypothetical protein
MYTLSFTNPQNEKSMAVIGWSGWPRNVATTTYPSSRECLVQVPRHIGAPSCCKSHCLHPTVEQGSAPVYQCRWMDFSNCNTHFAFSTSVKYAILMDDCSTPHSGDHGY